MLAIKSPGCLELVCFWKHSPWERKCGCQSWRTTRQCSQLLGPFWEAPCSKFSKICTWLFAKFNWHNGSSELNTWSANSSLNEYCKTKKLMVIFRRKPFLGMRHTVNWTNTSIKKSNKFGIQPWIIYEKPLFGIDFGLAECWGYISLKQGSERQ